MQNEKKKEIATGFINRMRVNLASAYVSIKTLVDLMLGFNDPTHLIEVDGLLPASRLHQQLVGQDAVVGAVPVAVEGDASGLPVLVEGLLETCRARRNKVSPCHPLLMHAHTHARAQALEHQKLVWPTEQQDDA